MMFDKSLYISIHSIQTPTNPGLWASKVPFFCYLHVSVDKELLKKRAEHNEGELSTLKEIALHQFDLEKIENLDIYCRHLEILLLQNNQISKIGIEKQFHGDRKLA
jgi:hypothetical protein